ncbi:glycosyltransferase family 4 protein [Gemmatimonadota bacterium]
MVHVVPALFGATGGVVGGAERYVFELARHMAAQVPTTLLTFGEEQRVERVESLDIRVLGPCHHIRRQRSNPVHHQMFSVLRKGNIVHCHQLHTVASSLAAGYCRLTRRRVFVTDLGGGGWDISAYVSTDRWYNGHLHISQYSRKVFGHEQKPWAEVILGGVDNTLFSPDASVTKKNHVLFVGRLLPHKGVDDLIEAVPADMPLRLIGHETNQKYLDDLRELARGKIVSFQHDCDDDELVRAYREALCIVLPSVYRDRYGGETRVPELLGQTLIEGMACGIPAICTNVASMPEVIQDGSTGFIVPPNNPDALGEKLRWLRANPNEAKRLGAAAREDVLDRFTWKRVVERCLHAYQLECK